MIRACKSPQKSVSLYRLNLLFFDTDVHDACVSMGWRRPGKVDYTCETTMIAEQRWQIILVSLCSWCIALVVGCKDTSHPDESQSKRTESVPRYGGTYHKAL